MKQCHLTLLLRGMTLTHMTVTLYNLKFWQSLFGFELYFTFSVNSIKWLINLNVYGCSQVIVIFMELHKKLEKAFNTFLCPSNLWSAKVRKIIASKSGKWSPRRWTCWATNTMQPCMQYDGTCLITKSIMQVKKWESFLPENGQIGRASCRERV